ncbi:MAG: hypothetical protein IPJ16_13055 [Bacteroidales bacterium]|nr:hypothetical protein [Bacteroidales bacterium]
MFELPEIKKKKRPKAPYRKPEAVKELERMADAEAIRLHPTCPHLAPRTFRDDSSNSLTQCIVKYITLKGGFASRINSTGIYDRKLHRYRLGTQKRGLADVMATFRGLSLHIEVKAGKDRQSEAQKKIESEVIRSGGYYYLARNFTEAKQWIDNL